MCLETPVQVYNLKTRLFGAVFVNFSNTTDNESGVIIFCTALHHFLYCFQYMYHAAINECADVCVFSTCTDGS